MSKFKVGDRVRITNMGGDYTPGSWVGTEGIVAKTKIGMRDYSVWDYRVDRDYTWTYFKEDELELVEPSLEDELEKARKFLEETKTAIAEFEGKLSEKRAENNKFTSMSQGTIALIYGSKYVKVAPDSWVLISNHRRYDDTHVFRDSDMKKKDEA